MKKIDGIIRKQNYNNTLEDNIFQSTVVTFSSTPSITRTNIHISRINKSVTGLSILNNIIIFSLILLLLGIYLISQGLPFNNFCIKVSNTIEFKPEDIMKCYPETRHYYFIK